MRSAAFEIVEVRHLTLAIDPHVDARRPHPLTLTLTLTLPLTLTLTLTVAPTLTR